MKAAQRNRLGATGEAQPIGDLGHRPDPGEIALLARHEEHAILVADVDRQRHGHVGEDDGVLQRNEPQGLQDSPLLLT
jgi:hypothetical protein